MFNLFQASSYYLITFSQGSFSFCELIAHLFSFLNNILLYQDIVLCLSIKLLKDTLVVSIVCVCEREREKERERESLKEGEGIKLLQKACA